jgi:hypothetical protein
MTFANRAATTEGFLNIQEPESELLRGLIAFAWRHDLMCIRGVLAQRHSTRLDKALNGDYLWQDHLSG